MQNMLMNCIGCRQFEADSGSFELNAGDLLLLSTDGLHDTVPEEEMESILRSQMDLRDRLEALADAAIADASIDDITIVAVEI